MRAAPPGRVPWTAAAVGAALGLAVLIVLHAARGLEYWNYSEGVYALSSRLLLHGGDLYGEIVAAQPPAMFLAGAGVLAVHDSLEWLRLAVGAGQLATGGLWAVAVWRLTGDRAATALAPALTLLTPWAVHEHGALTPELVAQPMLAAAAIALSRRGTVPAGAVLAGLLPFVKLPYGLAMVVLVLLAADRRRAIAWAAGTAAVAAVLSLAVFGGGLWRQAVVAQLHSGARLQAHALLGIWGQAAWSLAGLVVAAGVAVALRARLADAPLARLLTGLAAAMLFTVVTNVKVGTGLNILAPVEAALLPLALAGAVVAVRAREGRRAPAGLAVAGIAFTLIATASLLASPARTRAPFLYPTSKTGAWGRAASDAEVRAQVAVAGRCPPGAPFAGPPYFAFLSHRAMPAGQPDQFLTFQSTTLRAVAARVAAVQGKCPA